MPDLDEFLRNELRRTVRPVDVNDVSSRIDVRRTRRARARKVQSVALAFVVIAGSLGGIAVLRNVFGEPGRGVGPGSDARNGAIVYSEVRNAGQHLWVVNPDGSGARQLTIDPNASDTDPSISPDGRTVAFVRTGADGSSIYLIGIDGGGLRKLSPIDMSAVAPSWSPNGSRIAFAADDGIYVGSVDGSKPRLLQATIDAAAGFTWSPDGTKIAFSGPIESTGAHRNYDLWITSATLSGILPLDITPRTDASELSPAWSPDGSRILFSRSTASGASLMLMAPETQATPVEVTDGTNLDQNPSWSPDGTQIVFDRTGAGSTDVYTIRPDGSDLTLVARNAVDPTWQAIPSEPTPSSSPSPSPTGEGPVNIGLGFPVCDVRSMSADFDGDGTPDTASIATKMSDVGACPAPGTSTEILVVDLNGDRKADAVGGPLACPTGCEPFATPDVNADGLPEIAIVADRPDDGTTRIQLWDVTTPAGGSLAVIPFVDANGDPATFSWGTVNNWGGNGPEVFGVSCTSRTSPPLVTEWQAFPTGPGSWHISEHGYHVVGTELRSAFEDSYDVPGEETAFPDGGDTMCGAPVQPTR